ncbi:MAG: heavy-metal-associated domain-containing protein [Leptolyngbya sp. Prado105]|jgi:copper chaperone|nr:heavy-metal-associated domain-containing protein [Leptolyngbya sp. Prado105]
MTIQLTITDMMCSACVNTITTAIATIDPNAKVNADSTTKLVEIETQKPESEIRDAITQAGYKIA